jgi:hypothetical protein
VDWVQKLYDLEHWVSTQQADGYLTFTFTENGLITLMCGKEFPVPPSSKTPYTAGYVAEVCVGWSSENSEISLKPGDHIWAYGPTLPDAIVRLHKSVLLSKQCQCRLMEQEPKDV